jgi:hypothetical protein
MPVFGAVDQFIGTIERLEPAGMVVNGRFVPPEAIARVEVDRVYLSEAAAPPPASEGEPAGQRALRERGEVRTPDVQGDVRVPSPDIRPAVGSEAANPQNSPLFGSMGTTGSTAAASELPRWEDYRDRYRSTWEGRSGPDRPWTDHERAYRYGWESAVRGAQYRGRDYAAAESDLRAGWSTGSGRGDQTAQTATSGIGRAWDEIKEAVREGFERARSELTRPS